MKVLLTGATGQLGQALRQHCPQGIVLVATSRLGGEGLVPLDLADVGACAAVVQAHRPDWVLNAGAYTAVDKAEREPDLAMAVNAGAPAAMAQALVATGGRLLQISTDFVFNGQQGSPYRPDQAPNPLGVYGATKAAAEERVLGALPEGRARVLRTGWVYGPVGHNFCLTMLRLHRSKAAAGESLPVVADQVGCPTSTPTLAAACWRAIGVGLEPEAAGALPRILHWSDAGAASWYDFAVAIGELAKAAGLLERPTRVLPITTADYPTPARRPSYSLLDCSTSRQALDLKPVHWRKALGQVLAQLQGLG